MSSNWARSSEGNQPSRQCKPTGFLRARGVLEHRLPGVRVPARPVSFGLPPRARASWRSPTRRSNRGFGSSHIGRQHSQVSTASRHAQTHWTTPMAESDVRCSSGVARSLHRHGHIVARKPSTPAHDCCRRAEPAGIQAILLLLTGFWSLHDPCYAGSGSEHAPGTLSQQSS
jgi:hypothetical protein